MSKRLKAAIKRLMACSELGCLTTGPSPKCPYNRNGDQVKGDDLLLVADAYIAEHPADDDRLVTRDFMASIGEAVRDDSLAMIVQVRKTDKISVQVIWERVWIPDKGAPERKYGAVRVYRGSLANCVTIETKTRGDVRRLLTALGCQVKPKV